MRKFSSYGPVNVKLHYYVPRQALIEMAHTQLVGENPEEGGHYITVWAPRQCGKSWVMIQTLWRLMKDNRFDVLKLNLEHLKMETDPEKVMREIARILIKRLDLDYPAVADFTAFEQLFHRDILNRPLILIMDEFDALCDAAISGLVGVFRNVYNLRNDDPRPSSEKDYLLHGVALIGVRSVLGVDNAKGSPFNVQRSLHISRLTVDEVKEMFAWYERESGQTVEPAVAQRVYAETRGQPGLVSWFGELLTEGYEGYRPNHDRPIAANDFDAVYADAIEALPNNNILNIISKARQEPYKQRVLELFRTDKKLPFRYDDVQINFLYMNGVVDREKTDGKNVLRFPCPFVQKRLFNYFAFELFGYMGQIHQPFVDISDTITETSLNIRNLVRRYEAHLQKNRDWMLKDAPRRRDLRIYEAVFHFNLYAYLTLFLANKNADVWPEFPTGNGKVDLLVRYGGRMYGLELKSFTDESDFKVALRQAARYGTSMGLSQIWLVEFVDYIPDDARQTYEADHVEHGVTVSVVFVATGG